MKYIIKITLGLVLCAGFVTSCKDDDEPGIDGITVDKEEITIGAEGRNGEDCCFVQYSMGDTCIGALDCHFSGKWYRFSGM